MSTRVAFPFLTLGEAAVQASGWKIAVGETEPADAGDWLADWDPSIPLRIIRSVGIDFHAAAADLELDAAELELAVALRVGTGAGRLPRAIIARERRLLHAGNPVTNFDIIVEGSGLSTVLDLHVDLVLVHASTGSELSPCREGDRVWHDTKRVRIEGEEPRFPIEVADLSTLLAGSAAFAPWYLDWSPRDWTRDFHGAIRLYLNSNNRALVGRVEAEDPEILRALMADVMGQVCESLVRDPEASVIVESCGEGSLGAQAAHWLALAFPGRNPVYAQWLLEQRPGLFRASFQALAEQHGGDA